MQRIHSTVNVATLEADIGLHETGTIRALHMLWDPFSSKWDINTATGAIPFNKLMVLVETSFKAICMHIALPFFKLIQDLKNYRSITDHHSRPFAQYSPSTLILEGKQPLNLLHHSILFGLFVCLSGEEKAFYFVPETSLDLKVIDVVFL
jgi:hypothetical protein